nr:alpha beta hydrolase fold protein [Colletotrichum truncatum]KAF6789933.1 alpha beta hydrolase fold protein [Colletotrichum truncatum]
MEPPKSGWPDVPRNNLPPWDRVVDIVYHKYRRGQSPSDIDDAFGRSVGLFFADSNRTQDLSPTSPYLKLSASARFKICQILVSDHSAELPISLTHSRLTKEVWKDDEFTSLANALEPLQPYLRASFALHADIMVAFLMTEQFHITYSPFVNTYFDPLATLWLNRYGHFMQVIVLELDMTRFGFGPGIHAYKLRTGTVNLDILLNMFVETQMKRTSPIKSLVLLCRRFYGQRPDRAALMDTESSATGKEVYKDELAQSRVTQVAEERIYYCPDKALEVCEPLVKLAWRVDSMRLVGFSNQYTHSLLRRIFPISEDKDSLRHHSYRVAPSSVWPRLPGQSSWIDAGHGKITLDDHTRDYLHGLYSPEGAIQLPPPYFNPSTGYMSICPPVEYMDGTSREHDLNKANSICSYETASKTKGMVAQDVDSFENGVQGLVHRIRRSLSKRDRGMRP